MEQIQGEITFKDVDFRYTTDGPTILKKISFALPMGQSIGVVGSSGSGKSTIAKLLQRLYIPQGGRICIDGIDLGTIDPTVLRRQIGVVLQDSFLFNRTIRENIALIDPSISMERVIQAAKLSGAHAFIAELSNGYDTMVEEQGNNLSGGQRQRIAIARALINDPKILIFDEATSALDYESEKVIHENMQAICANRTVLIIAHRLSAVERCDNILVLEKGSVVEFGHPHELEASNGRYAQLQAIQRTTTTKTKMKPKPKIQTTGNPNVVIQRGRRSNESEVGA
jgi:subfamily B ATP-binding cassette protein HlyB/CyaB